MDGSRAPESIGSLVHFMNSRSIGPTLAYAGNGAPKCAVHFLS
jgi:hypothetical protein